MNEHEEHPAGEWFAKVIDLVVEKLGVVLKASKLPVDSLFCQTMMLLLCKNYIFTLNLW